MACGGTIVDGYCDQGGNCLFIVQEGSATFTLDNGEVFEGAAGSYVHITAAGVVTTGTYDGSILSIPATGVCFPLFGWWFRFDTFEDFTNFDAGDFDDALDSVVVQEPVGPPEPECFGSFC